MSNEHHVATSPLTNRIYAGKLTKDRLCWRDGRTDVTGEACAAVAIHAETNGQPVVVYANGKPKWEITVKKLD